MEDRLEEGEFRENGEVEANLKDILGIPWLSSGWGLCRVSLQGAQVQLP